MRARNWWHTDQQIFGRPFRGVLAVGSLSKTSVAIAAGARSQVANLIATSPADFGKLIADDTEKWGKVIRDANIKAE